MKKYLFLLVLVLPSIVFASIDTNLKYGARGQEVTELQEFLISKGLLAGQATGNFFSLTQKAVIAYQTSIGIPSTGFVGLLTRAKVNAELATNIAPTISAEISETGTISTPVQNSSIELLRKQIELLMQQVANLQKPIPNQTNTIKPNTFTLPNGTVIDAQGNVTSMPSTNTNTAPTQTTSLVTQPTPAEALKISSVSVVPDTTSVKIEWETSHPAESKLYLSGGGLSFKLYVSEAGYATKHFVSVNQLAPMTDYSFQITAIGSAGFINFSSGFTTKTPPPMIKFNQASQSVLFGVKGFKISWKSNYIDSCSASGAWSGSKPVNGEEILSFNQIGSHVYMLTCTGSNGENATESIVINVIDTKPKIIFYFNDILSNTFSGKIGETVKLRWEASNISVTNSCTASNSWNGSKYTGGSQNILLETAGEFSYTLTCINGESGEGGTNTATITTTQ